MCVWLSSERSLNFDIFFQLKELFLFLKSIQTELAKESKFRQLIVSFENKMEDLTQDGFKILINLFRHFSHVQIFFKNKWTFSIPNFEFFGCYKIQPQRLTFQFVFYWGLLNWSRLNCSYWTKYLSLLLIFRVMNLLYKMISVF